MTTASEKFSLKDHLFNRKKVEKIALEIKTAYAGFDDQAFIERVCAKFPKLELLERVHWIKQCLRESLPDDYQKAVKIILRSLPEPCDPSLTDDDFGDFIYSPYSFFVSEYGCDKTNLEFSLNALKELTTRFSVEAPIRDFINQFSKETLKELRKWATDDHYHIRRAASESTRPFLPWAKKIDINYSLPIPILDLLYKDQTRFVTRSVANHLNDISKIDKKLVIETLKKWQKSKKQSDKEMEFICSHSLRTLVKQGDQKALQLLGFKTDSMEVGGLQLQAKKVRLNERLSFSFAVKSTSKKPQKLMIDYIIYFQKANGDLSPKTFKIAKKTLEPNESIEITKTHLFREMTTKKLYPGKHSVVLQINGEQFAESEFVLVLD